jgi:O-antigen/teichoic acid export membrane protein
MRIRTRSMIIMISQGLAQATTIILGIILVRLITKETLGTYRQTMLVYAFLSGILSLQLENSLYYFIPKCDISLRRSLFLQTISTKLVSSLIVSVIMFFGAEVIANMFTNPELGRLLRIYSLYSILASVISLIPAFMISLDRAIRAGVYSMADAIGRIVVVVSMFALGQSLANVIWAITILAGIISTIGYIDMARLCPTGKWRVDRQLLIEQLHYTWPFLAISIIGIVNIQLDKIIISTFYDPATYAVYSCGAMELPLVALITGSINSAIMPNLVTLSGQGKPLAALALWQEAIRKSSLVIFPCFAFFIFLAKDFILLIYGKEYIMAAWPFVIYLCLLPIRIATYNTLFRAIGKTKPIAISAALNLALNAVLSPALAWIGGGSLLSFIGPSTGAVLSNIIAMCYLLWELSKMLNTPVLTVMRWKELGRIFGLSLLCGLLLWLIPLPIPQLLFKFAAKMLIYAIVFIVVIILTKSIKSDELELLLLPLTIIRKKLRKV